MRSCLVLVSLLAVVAVDTACQEDGSGGNECDKAAKLKKQAADEYCGDMTAQCCLCSCWSSTSGYYDIDAYVADNSCQCVDEQDTAQSSTNEDQCSGAALEEAETCLADKEACVQPDVQSIQVMCEGSPL